MALNEHQKEKLSRQYHDICRPFLGPDNSKKFLAQEKMIGTLCVSHGIELYNISKFKDSKSSEKDKARQLLVKLIELSEKMSALELSGREDKSESEKLSIEFEKWKVDFQNTVSLPPGSPQKSRVKNAKDDSPFLTDDDEEGVTPQKKAPLTTITQQAQQVIDKVIAKQNKNHEHFKDYQSEVETLVKGILTQNILLKDGFFAQKPELKLQEAYNSNPTLLQDLELALTLQRKEAEQAGLIEPIVPNL